MKRLLLGTIVLSFFFLHSYPMQASERFRRSYSKNFMKECMGSFYKNPSQSPFTEGEFNEICQCTIDQFIDRDVSELIQMNENPEATGIREYTLDCVKQVMD